MKIISVVGARPNFMKISPFMHAIREYNISKGRVDLSTHKDRHPSGNRNKPEMADKFQPVEHLLVHTGQHYDDRMSRSFFEALDIPGEDINLGVGSGTHAEQVGNTMIEFEKVLERERPDWVIVVGDVNATLACSVTAKKLHIKVCHIEAGLRSGDMQMPEEINRLVTDRISDLLLTPDHLSGENLKREGVPTGKIVFVGNIMIDILEAGRTKALALDPNQILEKNKLFIQGDRRVRNLFSEITSDGQEHLFKATTDYALMTLHRPSNVDHFEILDPLVDFLCDEAATAMPIIWPIHPRAEKRLKDFGLFEKLSNSENIILLYPIGYHEMLRLNMDARIMLTDSGGLQEECTILGTPCLTLRWNTERPITLQKHGGASVLVGNDIVKIREEYQKALSHKRNSSRPELWDGKTAGRCLRAILEYK